jgi:4-amino-4-deoxy-L-arabinose transferase-like glycosyltransferase
LDSLFNFLKKNKKTGIVSPVILDENLIPFKVQGALELTPMNSIFSHSFLRRFFPTKNILNELSIRKWDMKSPRAVEVVPGACLMIPSKLFKKVKGFDEKLFLYFEENDLSNKARSLGYSLYIIPKSKIIHRVAKSTSQTPNIEKIYKKSRFIYFKNNYGILNALIVEFLLSLNKYSLLILSLLALSFFIRTFNISISMPFIGDQGWFYLSSRDLLLTGNIPLVGITSSHTWLHQGPLWTYMLSLALYLFNFDPVAGAYVTALFGTATVFLLYKLGSSMFSKRVGFISALLYSISPYIVFFDRMPFDPSPIPFFTLLYIYSVYKWLKGDTRFFPFILFLIAVLYNLELATFILFFPFLLILLYGVYKRRKWAKDALSKKIVFYSLIAVALPMFPVIIYDLSHGFKQTIVFLGWTVYKPFSFLLKNSSHSFLTSFPGVINFLLISIQKIIVSSSLLISTTIFISSILYVFLKLYKERFKTENPNYIVFVFLLFSLLGIIINQTPSEAYLPVTFVMIILLVAIFFDFLLNVKKIRYFIMFFLFAILLSNFLTAFKKTYIPDIKTREEAADKIISLTNGNSFNLIGKGPGSQFRSFTMNYEYLLWWKGHQVSAKGEKIKVILTEDSKGIHVKLVK